jgi:hypothetical protein
VLEIEIGLEQAASCNLSANSAAALADILSWSKWCI